MKQLYNKYPFKSLKKFLPIAIEHGFTKKEATKFIKNLTHDVRYSRQEEMMLPIYSEHLGGYQFDTLVQSKNAKPKYFLIIINVNTRKLYSYPMDSKDSKSVLKVLKTFVNGHDVKSFTTDQDKAYLTKEITSFMTSHGIDHQTTFENDHTRLGIINRVIRTIRDLNDDRDFTINSMRRIVKAYNNTKHSSIDEKPNKMTDKQEKEYIKIKRNEIDYKRNAYRLNPDMMVRVFVDRKFGKRRYNITPTGYLIDSMMGNKYIIRTKDHNVSEFPRFKLYPDESVSLTKTMENQRGIVEKILSYKSGKYRIQYQGGVKDTLTARALREGRPTKISPLELEYWKNKEHIPKELIP